MRADVRSVPALSRPTWIDRWEQLPPLARGFGIGGLLLAFGLLIGFYVVVAGAVHRAELGRQQARLEVDRQAACSVFTRADARDLCALTAAMPPQGDVAHAVYPQPSWLPPRTQLATRLY